MNVYKLPYSWKYYLIHPVKFIRALFRNVKRAFQRAGRGFCDLDVWEMFTWFQDVVPKMLYQLADKGSGMANGFSSEDEWQNHLKKIADLIYSTSDKESMKRNQYDRKSASFMNENGLIEVDYSYYSRQKEIQEENAKRIEEAFEMLSKVFFSLWD